MSEEVLAVVNVSVARRWLAIGLLLLVGGAMIYAAFTAPPSAALQAFLIAGGALALWMADKMRRATETWLELTQTELRDNTGRILARVADIRSLDRGFLAFKPSNGFLIRTKTPGPRAWMPGLWWRAGRRIGVGGVTSGVQTRIMADLIAAMVRQRDQDSQST